MQSLGFLRTSTETQVPHEYQNGLVFDIFEDGRASTVKIQTENINRFIGVPPEISIDLLMIATAVYSADKKILRKDHFDAWTRSISLNIPVSSELWHAAEKDLIDAISFLTSDNWSFDLRIENSKWHGPRYEQIPKFSADAVVLFSGGIDSLVGTIDLLEQGKRLILVSHFESTADANVQQKLKAILVDQYGSNQILHIRVNLGPKKENHTQAYPLPGPIETTARSRSIIFLALGFAIASSVDSQTPLFVPENGFISLNVPLTKARLGSCSTRTTHPYFISTFLNAIRKVGVNNPVVNPYQFTTKGEMLQNCLNKELLQKAIPLSLSCAHPTAGRWYHEEAGNCGYCYPCLIRRAAVHKVEWDKIDEYKHDICRDERLIVDTNKGNDMRAVAISLSENRKLANSALLPLLSGRIIESQLSDFADLYKRGLDELNNLLIAEASPQVRKILGI